MGWRGMLRSMAAQARRMEREQQREANRIQRAQQQADSMRSKLTQEARSDARKVQAFEDKIFRAPIQTLRLHYDKPDRWVSENLVDRTGQITFSIGPGLVSDALSHGPPSIEFEGKCIAPIAFCLSEYATFVAFSVSRSPGGRPPPSRRLVNKSSPQESSVLIIADDQAFYAFDASIDGPIHPGIGKNGIVAFEPFVAPIESFQIVFLPLATKEVPDPEPVIIKVGGAGLPDTITRNQSQPSLVQQFEEQISSRLAGMQDQSRLPRQRGSPVLLFAILAAVICGICILSSAVTTISKNQSQQQQPIPKDGATTVTARTQPKEPASLTKAEPKEPRALTTSQLVEAHCRTLKEQDGAARRRAAAALGKMGPAAAAGTSTLVEALKDNDPAVSVAAANALGSIGPPAKSATPSLAQAMKSGNAELRQSAADALLRIGSDASTTQVWIDAFKDKELAPLAAKALGILGGAAVPELIKALKDANPGVRVGASEVLGQLEAEASNAAPVLLELLRDENEQVRQAAAKALSAIRPPIDLLKNLAELLKDQNDQTRMLAITVLGKTGWDAKMVAPLLIEALKDKNLNVRSAAALALGSFAAEARTAIPMLIGFLKDNDNELRSHAIDTLAKIGPHAKDALPALVKLLTDADMAARTKSIEALGKIDSAAEAARPVLEIIAKNNPYTEGVVPNAIKAFNAVEVKQRCACFEFLGKLANLGMPFLTAGLKDGNQDVRAAAGKTLAVADLIKLLSHRETTLRAESAKALAMKGPAAKDAAGPLVAALKDQFPSVRAAAEQALVRIGKLAVPEVIRSLKSADANVRTRGARILAHIGPDAKEAIPALTQAAKDPDPAVSLEAREALIKIQR